MNTLGKHSAQMKPTGRPVLAASCVVFRADEVLLIKRSQEPFKGQWGLPGGKVEFGETVLHAAQREVLEETGIIAKIIGMAGLYEVFTAQAHYAVAAHAAVYEAGEVKAATDAAEARFVPLVELNLLNLLPFTLESTAAARLICQI